MDLLRHKLVDSIRRRLSIFRPGHTDGLRLVNGAFDDLPGLELDRFGDHWLLSTRDVPLEESLRKTIQAVACEEGAQSLWWKRLAEDNRESSPIPIWEQPQSPTPEEFPVHENGLRFLASFRSGYSQGIFLDQRDNRQRLREEFAPGKRVLNTFAYTCTFSVTAAAGGAKETCSLDLSKPYLKWGESNFMANGFDPVQPEHDFIFGDVFDWMKRLAGRGREFEVIILDPPSFSRNKRGKVFRVEQHYDQLVTLAEGLLPSSGGHLLCCTNLRKLPDRRFTELIRKGIAKRVRLSQTEMPPDFQGDNYLKSIWVEV